MSDALSQPVAVDPYYRAVTYTTFILTATQFVKSWSHHPSALEIVDIFVIIGFISHWACFQIVPGLSCGGFMIAGLVARVFAGSAGLGDKDCLRTAFVLVIKVI